jgi:hypothetical protein
VGLAGEKDRVTGGLGELLDARSHIHGVADQRELELAAAAESARDSMPIRSAPPNRSATRP